MQSNAELEQLELFDAKDSSSEPLENHPPLGCFLQGQPSSEIDPGFRDRSTWWNSLSPEEQETVYRDYRSREENRFFG